MNICAFEALDQQEMMTVDGGSTSACVPTKTIVAVAKVVVKVIVTAVKEASKNGKFYY